MTPAGRWRVRRVRRSALVALCGALTVTVLSTVASADDDTVSYDNYRTGWDANEPALQADAADFGQLFDTHVDGPIYAQPLVVQSSSTSAGTLLAATENNEVAGLDPVSGAIRWQRNLGPAWPSSTIDCGSVSNMIGITSTPVYDPATKSVYVMAKTNDGPDPEHPHWQLHALNPKNGKERNGWPVVIGGYPDNDRQHAFDPETEAQRPGLLLLGGVIYAGFASLCDHGPYVGDVVGVNATTHVQTTMWSTEAGTADGQAGIWQSGGGLVSDGPNQILLSTGNGLTSAPSPGHQPPARLGESVVRLHVGADGILRSTDYFTPVNSTLLNTDDTDLGSGGPLAIPGSFAGKHLLVEVGKDGRVFLLDRDNLGGNAQGPNGTDDVLGITGPFNGVWGHPAYWPGPDGSQNQGGYVYDVENQGYLRAFQVGTDAGGDPVLSSSGTSAQTFGYTSGSPVVTSDGTAAGSALVWVPYVLNDDGDQGELRVYRAIPQDGVMQLVRSFPMSTGTKFGVAATDNNRVFVANHAGEVYGFGTPTAAAVEAAPTNFGDVAVGSAETKTVTITATRSVTIDSVTADGPFAVTGTPSGPLTAGQSLPVSVTFTPSDADEVDTQLQVATTEGANDKTDYLDLFGTGTQLGIAANPQSLAFGEVPTSASKTFDVNIINTGTDPIHLLSPVLSGDSDSHPFTVGGGDPTAPAIPPQGSLAIPVTYAPTEDAADSATLMFTSAAGGTAAEVSLTGSAVTGAAHLTLTPNPLSFQTVPLGSSRTKNFKVRNTGNIALTISKAAPPSGAFTATPPIDEGLTLPPGEAIRASITFAPHVPGRATAAYTISSDDGNGAQDEVLKGRATDPIAAYYASLGGRSSALGAPVTPESAIAYGRMRTYRHGAIFWSASSGAHALSGPILKHYQSLSGPISFAKFPTTDVVPIRFHAGSIARFYAANTAIYHSKASGTWEVHGGIRKRWLALGGVRSQLGYPTSDEHAVRHHGRRNSFQHGSITYDTRTGTTTVVYRH